MYYVKKLILIFSTLMLLGCGDMMDDLDPSGSDNRLPVVAGSTGNMPGQIVADFSLKDSLDSDFVLSDHLDGGASRADVVVLYFTMWCPVCLAHSDHMLNTIVPSFANRGDVVFALVDYVSGSVAATRAAERANGFANSAFITLSDVNLSVFDQLNGAMGSVVVVDSDGTVLMNEDYRNGVALSAVLDQQLP